MLQSKAKCNHRAFNPHSELPMYCGLDWDHLGRHQDRNWAHSWDSDGMYCDHIAAERAADAKAKN